MPGPVSQLIASETTSTSINLTWMVPENIFIDRFEVTYNYTVKRCPAPQGANVTVNIPDSTARTHILENLNEDSTYRITVTAINNEGSTMNTTTVITGTSSNACMCVMTQAAILTMYLHSIGASSGPSNVTVTAGVTNISIQWNEVDCVERNGEISDYSVRYGLNSSMSQEINVTNRSFSIDRLQIRTSYSFEVAAVNISHGVGAYSSAVIGTTVVPNGKQSHCTVCVL